MTALIERRLVGGAAKVRWVVNCCIVLKVYENSKACMRISEKSGWFV